MNFLKGISAICVVAVFLTWACSTKSDPAPTTTVSKFTTYNKNILPLMQANCTPCHFPKVGGFKKPLDTYIAASDQINEIIRRINLDPSDTSSMPYLQFRTLTADQKLIFQKWKDDGLLEK